MGLFEDSRRRIERASTHRKTFSDGWNTAIQEDSYIVKVETDRGHGIVKALRLKPMGIDLALEIGEFFYQVRSALDNAIFKAAELQIGTYVAQYEDRLYFPIHANKSGFDNSAFGQIPFPNELREWIESIQPYPISAVDSRIAGLRIINDCARKDRHRKLHVVAGFPTEIGGMLHLPSTASIKNVSPLASNLLEDEAIFLQFWYDGVCPSDQVYMDGGLTVEISVNEIPVKGPRLSYALSYILMITTEIVDKIESFYL